eukprot:TRINITY_DN18188_c0_g1_i1.p2 TRINITY_DN18188_c0_g1~~TRINITY_DN18188_c0_g1_i1.p2  ORF type:complete len:117 (+),score=2.61 TRINITY_DN18188_c0_g1_i1:26-376(+)
MDAVGLPVTRQHGSSLKTGPRGLLSETLPKHPVEQVQLQKQQKERMKREGLANVFGQHMPMRLAYEEAVVSRPLASRRCTASVSPSRSSPTTTLPSALRTLSTTPARPLRQWTRTR